MNVDSFIEKNRENIKLFLSFLLIFILGFASGFYYEQPDSASESLIIEESNCDYSNFFNSTVDSGSVLSANSIDDNKTENNPSNIEQKEFVASKNSNLYHKANCPYVKRIKEENLVWYSSEKEAEADGKQPHDCVYE